MNRKIKNLEGMKFARLSVIGLDESKKSRKSYWVCQCDCGNVKSVRSDSLQSGKIRSCGCLKKEQDKTNLSSNHSHKQSGTRIYNTWLGMKSRCYKVSDSRYERYGGRGIRVCDQWINDFTAFYEWSIKNGYENNLTIDRIDNDGNYEPNNCRFATIKDQCNNRSTNIIIKFNDQDYTLQQACEILNMPYGTIIARYHRGRRGLELFEPIR